MSLVLTGGVIFGTDLCYQFIDYFLEVAWKERSTKLQLSCYCAIQRDSTQAKDTTTLNIVEMFFFKGE